MAQNTASFLRVSRYGLTKAVFQLETVPQALYDNSRSVFQMYLGPAHRSCTVILSYFFLRYKNILLNNIYMIII